LSAARAAASRAAADSATTEDADPLPSASGGWLPTQARTVSLTSSRIDATWEADRWTVDVSILMADPAGLKLHASDLSDSFID
jgi:hypothetical protein